MSDRQLNDEQRAVVNFVADREEALQVEALAGCGKTAVLIHAASVLLENGLPAHELQFTAFGKNDQRELESRLPEGVRVNTVHSLILGAMRANFHGINLDVKGEKMRRIMRRVFADVEAQHAKRSGYRLSLWSFSRSIQAAVRLAKTTLDATEVTARARLRKAVTDARAPIDVLTYATMRCLEASLADSSQIDFDDLIYFAAHHDVWPVRTPSVVAIDEAQDISYGQLHFLMKFAVEGARVLSIGDQGQSLYEFIGADAHSMRRISESTGSQHLPMRITYRCSEAVCAYIQETCGIPLTPRPDAPAGSVSRCSPGQLKTGVRPGDYVLSRNNATLFETAVSLLEAGKPVVVSGVDIGRELGDLAKQLHLDNAMLRADALRAIDTYCARQSSLFAATDFSAEEREIAAAGLQRNLDLARAMRAVMAATQSVGAAFDVVKQLDRGADPGKVVSCSTVHAAKGRERNRVFLLAETFEALRPRGEEDAPLSQEDFNLHYVAASRARDDLIIVGDEE